MEGRFPLFDGVEASIEDYMSPLTYAWASSIYLKVYSGFLSLASYHSLTAIPLLSSASYFRNAGPPLSVSPGIWLLTEFLSAFMSA